MSARRPQKRSADADDDVDDNDDAIQSIAQRAEQLKQDGFIVLEPDWMMDPKKRELIRREFLETLAAMPEFKPGAKTFVMGGFSALGNPSSFHNPWVRGMRLDAMGEVLGIMEAIRPDDRYRLEQLFDRMMFRPSGVSATAESWHRDEAALAHPTDLIFGGWWNLDDEDQIFSCVPGTHRGVVGHAGFAPIKDKATIRGFKDASVQVRVPPGSILIFYERIVHEVVSRKASHDMFRLFLGWRLTTTTEPLYPLGDKLKRQAVMPLKSNQVPPMYARLHWTNWRGKIDEFTEYVNSECTEVRRVESGAHRGEEHVVVHQLMRSLEDYGFPLYPPYRESEIAMHTPQTTFKVRRGVDDVEETVSWTTNKKMKTGGSVTG
mgnify:FL=1|tara:strand:- start:6 stop:1136 length:1131 start_codon:yes stop_codon:yes gene_type:complete